jgi:Tfp pilus assembly protein PilF
MISHSKNPQFEQAIIKLAFLHFIQQDFINAIQYLEKAIKLNPK